MVNEKMFIGPSRDASARYRRPDSKTPREQFCPSIKSNALCLHVIKLLVLKRKINWFLVSTMGLESVHVIAAVPQFRTYTHANIAIAVLVLVCRAKER